MRRTDLILNTDGSIYHLGIHPEHVANVVITVGDPSRVSKVSQYFDKVFFQQTKREFVTHFGEYQGVPMTVLSTGIGVDNTEIALVELDALVNVDLDAVREKNQKRRLTICRVGTSGALSEEIDVGSLLVSKAAIGTDNLMSFYDLEMNEEEEAACLDFMTMTGLLNKPYIQSADMGLTDHFSDLLKGVTLTTPGFYAPQGRSLRISTKDSDYLQKLAGATVLGESISNFEMETAAIYALSRLMGHRAISLNAILANRITDEFSSSPGEVIDLLIETSLDRLASWSKRHSQKPS